MTTMRLSILKIFVMTTILGLCSFANSVQAEIHGFPDQPVTPDQETSPVVSTGSGTLNAVYDDVTKELIYFVEYTLDGSNTMSAAHFHGPASAGADASVQIPISGSGANSGTIYGSATLTAGQETDLLAGLWYVNIHSNVYSAGELRGQLNAGGYTHSFSSLVADGTQGPTTVSPAGSGLISAAYNATSNTLTYGLTFTGMTSNVNAGHFHGPATEAQTAGPVVTINNLPADISGATAGTAILSSGEESDLLSELWYLNIHTVNNSGGEIRTQMIPDSSGVEDWYLMNN